MRHFLRLRSEAKQRQRAGDRRVWCEVLEGRLAPGDVLAGPLLTAGWWGRTAEDARPAEARPTPAPESPTVMRAVLAGIPQAEPFHFSSAEPAEQGREAADTVAVLTRHDHANDASFTLSVPDDLLTTILASTGQGLEATPRPALRALPQEADTPVPRADLTGPTSRPPVSSSPPAEESPAAGRSGGVSTPHGQTTGQLIQLTTGISGTSTPANRLDHVLREWTIPTPNSQPHDIIADDEGIVWFTEIAANKIGRFDPATRQFREWTLPTPGGNPHGLCVAPDNGIWFTEQGGNKIGRIDRTTFVITEYPLPNPNSGPHTPHHDGFGRVWFTEQSGNRIGRINVYTGIIEEWTLPRPGSGPYGIVADAGGHGWFCEFGSGSNRIGRIDAQTGVITEYFTPTANSGPRRLWFDSHGLLWITANRGNQLTRFDPSTEQFREWNTPHANGQPYAITVDHDDMVWYTEFNANYMIRFDPGTEVFTSYPMPTAQERVRFIYVDPFNQVWYENNGNSAIGVVVKHFLQTR